MLISLWQCYDKFIFLLRKHFHMNPFKEGQDVVCIDGNWHHYDKGLIGKKYLIPEGTILTIEIVDGDYLGFFQAPYSDCLYDYLSFAPLHDISEQIKEALEEPELVT